MNNHLKFEGGNNDAHRWITSKNTQTPALLDVEQYYRFLKSKNIEDLHERAQKWRKRIDYEIERVSFAGLPVSARRTNHWQRVEGTIHQHLQCN